MNAISDDYKQLRRQHEDVLRLLAVMVERAGGEVLLLSSDLAHDRQLSRDEPTGMFGAVRLRSKRT